MADQTKEQVKKSLENAIGGDNQNEQEIPEVFLFAGVTQEQLDKWKADYKEVHIITVKVTDHESLTGYFKKPGRDIMANCINLVADKKLYEAREFLLNNTWIGGDKKITTDFNASVAAQTKLWSQLNFLTAEGKKY
jgi:hypothetical protein